MSTFRVINAIGDRPTVQGFVIKEASGVEAQDAAVPEVELEAELCRMTSAVSVAPSPRA